MTATWEHVSCAGLCWAEACCAPAAPLQVSFYMRKGADLLSKWVGEAEKQLRLLFEEASKHQPSIIFFDEIDGLAPVRRRAAGGLAAAGCGVCIAHAESDHLHTAMCTAWLSATVAQHGNVQTKFAAV